MKPRFVVISLLFLTLLSPAWALRYSDAVYLEDLKDYPPIILKVEKTTTIFSDRYLKGGLLNAIEGEDVKLLAIADDAYQVSSTKGRYIGWADPESLTALKPETIKEIKALIADEARYQDAVSHKQVITGMTPAHVKAAIGKPNKISNRKDDNGSYEVWAYVITEPIYESVPVPSYVTLPNGTVVTQTTYQQRKVGDREISATTVEFHNGRVSAVENRMNKDRTINPGVTQNLVDPDHQK